MEVKWTEIAQILYCEICAGRLVPPVFQCGKGHTGCENCFLMEEMCRCGGKLGSRNYAAETLLEALIGECELCGVEMRYLDLKSHSKVCLQRKYPCSLCHGYTHFSLTELQSHFNSHQIMRKGTISTMGFRFEEGLTPESRDKHILVEMQGTGQLLLKLFEVGAGVLYLTVQVVGVMEVDMEVKVEVSTDREEQVHKAVRAGEQTILFRVQNYSNQTLRFTFYLRYIRSSSN